jgi:hypothetical protein
MTMDTGIIEMVDDPESTQKLYAKTNYVLRESRKALLKRYEVEDEAALLEKIRSGQVREHPAYDHYLSALILEQTRQCVRADMLAQLGDSSAEAQAPVSVHFLLKEKLEAQYAHCLAEPVRMAQDALLLSFDCGLLMEVRYFSADEYSLNWSWGDAELRIDTAPTHPECPTFPHHLHGDDGTVRTDPVTLPGTDWWASFSRLLDVLLVNPLLEPAA